MTNLGQTLTEFLIWLLVLGLVVVLVGGVIHYHWKRTQCAYWVFEATHARRTHRPQPNAAIPIFLHEKPDRWVGRTTCGTWTEEVELPKLDGAQW